MPMVELSEVVDRLTAAGYRGDFAAEGEGLRVAGGRLYAIEELVVDRVERLEGPTDPDEEVIVLALSAADGARGTYVSGYGPSADRADAALLPRLLQSRANKQ